MSTRSFATFAAFAFALAIPGEQAIAQPDPTQIAIPPLPGNLHVPAGNVAYLKAQATGTQNQICIATASGYLWKFTGPQATLFVTFKFFNMNVVQQVTTHYLSPNPEEAGELRATWQSSLDTSTVWAKMYATSDDPAYVAPGAIPWLLLEKAGTRLGPNGGGLLAETTFIHRVNTSGGRAPATGCSEPGHIGNIKQVPYTTDYIFYKARKS